MPIPLPKPVRSKRIDKKVGQRTVRPRLASTLILLAGPKDDPHILMGQRSAGHTFMPGVYVFPGGRVDRYDSYAPHVGEVSPRTQRILEAAMRPRRARACILAGIRETYEETSLRIAQRTPTKLAALRDAPWQDFVGDGFLPDMSGIEVLGRATTPPYRHKRFDTWFFVKWLSEDIPHIEVTDSAELENVGWHDLDKIEGLKTHAMTDYMLLTLNDYLGRKKPKPNVPYHRMVRGVFVSTPFPGPSASNA